MTLYFCDKQTGEILYTFHPENLEIVGFGARGNWLKFQENGSPVEIRMDCMNYYYRIVNE